LIEDFPGIKLISLDLSLARRAAQIAIEHRLRGADAAYVAVADTFDAVLISWDQEMLKRCPAAVKTMTPEEWCGDR
jgi:predicted nucleic acid-binding protein